MDINQRSPFQFDFKEAIGIRKISREVSIGYNLYDNSGQMEEYKNNFFVRYIDVRDDSIDLLNMKKILRHILIVKEKDVPQEFAYI